MRSLFGDVQRGAGPTGARCEAQEGSHLHLLQENLPDQDPVRGMLTFRKNSRAFLWSCNVQDSSTETTFSITQDSTYKMYVETAEAEAVFTRTTIEYTHVQTHTEGKRNRKAHTPTAAREQPTNQFGNRLIYV